MAHAIALELDGGLDGIRSTHQLAAAVHQPQQTAFGEDIYPGIAEKAAAYGYFLAQNQPFIDGNKRTAALMLLGFLDVNGYVLDQSDDHIADMFIGLGERTIDRAQFFAWVVRHTRPQDASSGS